MQLKMSFSFFISTPLSVLQVFLFCNEYTQLTRVFFMKLFTLFLISISQMESWNSTYPPTHAVLLLSYCCTESKTTVFLRCGFLYPEQFTASGSKDSDYHHWPNSMGRCTVPCHCHKGRCLRHKK